MVNPKILNKVNRQIRADVVRVVTEEENIPTGVFNLQAALALAEEHGLDLVEISPTANPPVCKIIEFGKFKYDKKKQLKNQQNNQTDMKSIRFTPNTETHDFEFKVKQAEKFLTKESAKVQAYVEFKGGRELYTAKERGELVLLNFAERLKEIANLESLPKLEGKRMFAIFSPKSKK